MCHVYYVWCGKSLEHAALLSGVSKTKATRKVRIREGLWLS